MFGRFVSLFSKKKSFRVIIVGLDGAGKTTLLFKLKLGEQASTIPSIGFQVETTTYKDLTFIVWDLGDQEKIRPLWKHYFVGLNGIIYIVDSNDTERLEGSFSEFKLLMEQPDIQEDVPCLIYANKVFLR